MTALLIILAAAAAGYLAGWGVANYQHAQQYLKRIEELEGMVKNRLPWQDIDPADHWKYEQGDN